MYSLRQTLLRNLGMAAVLLLALLLLILSVGIGSLTRDYVASRLQHDAEGLVAALEQDDNGLWFLPQERIPSIYQRARSGHYFEVVAGNTLLRSRSLFDTTTGFPAGAKRSDCLEMAGGFGDEEWLACRLEVKKRNQSVVVWVAEDIAPLLRARVRFLLFVALAVVVSIALLLVVQFQILQRGFASLDGVRESIRRMTLGGTDRPSAKLPREIQPLVEEINRLLVQLGQRVNRSRNALGNLAHELKKPLQRYRLWLEKLAPEQRREGELILSDLQALIERELRRARIVGAATPGRQTVLEEDLVPLVQMLGILHPAREVLVEKPDNLVLPHDRDDMLELLGNLLDNACHHASKTVWLTCKVEAAGWRLVVEDDGEGVAAAGLSQLAERGARLDESREGHGMGLSICKEIVAGYGGTLAFSSSAHGGLKVEVILPVL